MEDKEIIKALECCSTPNCKGCPFDSQDCVSVDLYSLALALINRQKEIIEQTQTNLRNRDFDMVVMQGTINRQKAEIERLQDLIEEAQQYNEAWVADNGKLRKEAKNIKAEAVKEFAERVKEKIRTMSRIVVYDEDIDNLVKEFTEGEQE